MDLVICALCLRVQQGSDWIDANQVIRELRSFEHEEPPRLNGVICDDCADSIFRRRAEAREPLAA
jgi:hypothetical protein